MQQRDEWNKLLPPIVDQTTMRYSMAIDAVCFDCDGAASMHCLDCGVDIYYCEPCCRDVHSIRHKYHTPEYWTGCRFIPSPFLNISVGMEHSGCQSNFVEKLTIIGINREFRTVVRNPA